jgi:autotransporter family porin
MVENGGVARSRPLPLLVLFAALLALGVSSLGVPSGAAAKAKLKDKIGWGPMKDRKAARKVTKTAHEPKPQNVPENHTVPTKAELEKFHQKSDMPYARYVTGNYKGTTDDIIEWAAYKWGLPEDVLRAVAVKESTWDMDRLGDYNEATGKYDSFGIFQVRRPYHCCLPFMRDSTAFNADYYGGIVRAYFDGKQDWLNNPDVAPDNGKKYRPGDLWGSVGAWYTGRWHTPANDNDYVAPIKDILKNRVWETDPNFDEG